MNRTKIIDLLTYNEHLTQDKKTHNVETDLIEAIQNLIQRLRDCNPIIAPVGKEAKESF